jgi:hypothetical protein
MPRKNKKSKEAEQAAGLRGPVPPGATRRAADRPRDEGGGGPGSGAGPRHAAADSGSPDESYEATDSNEPLAEIPQVDELEPLEEGPPYAGISGGAVGGTPAQGRSSGGRIGRGIAPGSAHRGDSTIGSEADSPTRRSRRGKEKRR